MNRLTSKTSASSLGRDPELIVLASDSGADKNPVTFGRTGFFYLEVILPFFIGNGCMG